MKTVLLYFLSLTAMPFMTLAQPSLTALEQKLLDNPNIIWLGELTINYRIDKPNEPTTTNELKTLKLQVENYEQLPPSLLSKIIENITKITTYKDPHCLQANSRQETQAALILRQDSSIGHDYNRMKETLIIDKEKMSLANTPLFRVRQFVYFDQQQQLFIVLPLAIAPLWEKEKALFQPIFWLPIVRLNRSPSLHSKNIKWAKRSYQTINFVHIKIKKETQKLATTLSHLVQYWARPKNPNPLRDPKTKDGISPLNPNYLQQLATSKDTLWQLNPVSFAEEIKTIRDSPLKVENITKIKVLQDWFWLEKSHKIAIYYEGFETFLNYYDFHQKYSHSLPLFHLKSHSPKAPSLD